MQDQELDALQEARLRFSTDAEPGMSRKKAAGGFQYFDAHGRKVEDDGTLERIRKLVIPPAWTDVWICRYANGHIQATGRDAKGRKQYRYHERWKAVAQERKYFRLIDFAKSLPKIRERVRSDLGKPGLPREKVLATIVQLLEETLVRVGNESYVRENKSFGLTTLRNRHVGVQGDTVKFEFKGKSGVPHSVRITDRRVARTVRRLQELPGQKLFEYLDESGERRAVTSDDVNDYLREITGSDITAKDFRTWAGTNLAARLLDEHGACDTDSLSNLSIVATVKDVASRLRNKPATCRKYYIHPLVFEAFQKGYVLSNLLEMKGVKRSRALAGLDECENKVLRMLSAQAAQASA